MNQTLEGEVAIISGGLGDIGRAIALELARRGARVAVGDVQSGEISIALLRSLNDLGIRARCDSIDVSCAAEVDTWINSVEKDLGVPTLIIPNAAIVTPADAMELTPEQWTR